MMLSTITVSADARDGATGSNGRMDAEIHRDAPLIAGVHRLIRRVEAGEGPFHGDLVSCDGLKAVCVDVAAVTDDALWQFAGAEHVAGPLDFVRRNGGQDVLLPWCTSRVERWMVRGLREDTPRGELVTLAVSIVRGLCELDDQMAVARGSWWLTDEGRPVFVLGSSSERSAAEEAGDILERIVEGVRDRSLATTLREIVAALERPRVRDVDRERWESQLLELAAPRPLATSSTPDGGHRVAQQHTSRCDAIVRDDAASDGFEVPRTRAQMRTHSGVKQRGARRIDSRARGKVGAMAGARAEIERCRETFGLVLSSVRERADVRSRRRKRSRSRRSREASGAAPHAPRRRLAVIAGVAVAAVLATGMLWPSGEAESATSHMAPRRAAGETPQPITAAPTGEPSSGVTASAPQGGHPSTPEEGHVDSPMNVVGTLLEGLSTCAEQQDTRCDDALVPGASLPSVQFTLQEVAAADIELVDDYGDVAVVKASLVGEAHGGAARSLLVVVQRVNDGWLLRDVYDAVQQPPEAAE